MGKQCSKRLNLFVGKKWGEKQKLQLPNNLFITNVICSLILILSSSFCGITGNPLHPELSQSMRAPTKKSIEFLPYLSISIGFPEGFATETKSLIGKALDSIRIIFHLAPFEDTLQNFIIPDQRHSIILDEPSYSIARKYTTENSYIGKLLYYMRMEEFQLFFFEKEINDEHCIFELQTNEFQRIENLIGINSSFRKKILETPMNILILQLSQCILEAYARMAQPMPENPNLLKGMSELFKLFYKRNQTLPELSRIFHGYQYYLAKKSIIVDPVPKKQ